jgi:transcriptional regulator with XRE-family HTH domain
MDENMIKDIGNRIKGLRNECGLKQQEMAEYLGIGRSNYSRIETGDVLPTLKILLKLIDNFNISINWLLTGASSRFSDLDEYGEDIREMLDDMQKDKALKHSILCSYFTIKQKAGTLRDAGTKRREV